MLRQQPARLLMTTVLFAFLILSFIFAFRGQRDEGHTTPFATSYKEQVTVDQGILRGGATAPKLENATLKAELGHAAWKVLHTMMAKFPDEPTEDDKVALRSYIHLFARLYPCGDCARHFQKLLRKFPPQVSNRSTAAVWACHVHNQVNKRLKKEIFDCSKIGDFYDCGCAEEKGQTGKKKVVAGELVLEKEGLTRGG